MGYTQMNSKVVNSSSNLNLLNYKEFCQSKKELIASFMLCSSLLKVESSVEDDEEELEDEEEELEDEEITRCATEIVPPILTGRKPVPVSGFPSDPTTYTNASLKKVFPCVSIIKFCHLGFQHI